MFKPTVNHQLATMANQLAQLENKLEMLSIQLDALPTQFSSLALDISRLHLALAKLDAKSIAEARATIDRIYNQTSALTPASQTAEAATKETAANAS